MANNNEPIVDDGFSAFVDAIVEADTDDIEELLAIARRLDPTWTEADSQSCRDSARKLKGDRP